MKIKKLIKIIGKGFLLLICLLIVIGFTYEQISRYETKEFVEERIGSFVDVGGHQLYYEKKGDGNVTVIFESGAPGDHRAWDDLSDTVSEFSTTLSYDRAGLLWSERGSNTKTPNDISTDLETVLTKEGFNKPYVVVGHSAAGIYLRPFIEKHQDDILGVIFIDPSHPDQLMKAPEKLKEYMQPPFFPPEWLVSLLNEVGLIRLLSGDPLIYRGIRSGGVYDEIEFLMNETSRSSRSSKSWKVPLVVISAGAQDSFGISDVVLKNEMQEYWSGLQIEISQLSENGKRIVAEKSGHNMLDSEAKLITEEIIKIIKSHHNTQIE